MLTADHPTLALLADTLAATRPTPGATRRQEAEAIAGLLGHAMSATGYRLIRVDAVPTDPAAPAPTKYEQAVADVAVQVAHHDDDWQGDVPSEDCFAFAEQLVTLVLPDDEVLLMGAREAAEELGVQVPNLRATAGLPAPVAELKSGPVFWAHDIKALAARRRKED